MSAAYATIVAALETAGCKVQGPPAVHARSAPRTTLPG